jgi:hypothetical protein
VWWFNLATGYKKMNDGIILFHYTIMPQLAHSLYKLFATVVANKTYNIQQIEVIITNITQLRPIKPYELYNLERDEDEYNVIVWKQRVKDLYNNVLVIPKTLFKYRGHKYLIDSDNIIYDVKTQREVGILDETNRIDFV